MQLTRNHSRDWLGPGMDSDVAEQLSPDDMYLALQADMVNIKTQEEDLKTEIDDIADRLHELLKTCGMENDFSGHLAAPPTTPEMSLQPNRRSTINYEDYLVQMMLDLPSSYLEDSDQSEHCANLTKMKVVDDNDNYVSQHQQDTAMNTSQSSESSTDSQGDTEMSSGYPKSSEDSKSSIDKSTDTSKSSNNSSNSTDKSSDAAPECYDLEKEMQSRMHYYSDFTIDRQRKINSMLQRISYVSGLKGSKQSLCDPSERREGSKQSLCDSSERPVVEGSEDRPTMPVNIRVNATVSTSSSDNVDVSCPASSGPTSSSNKDLKVQNNLRRSLFAGHITSTPVKNFRNQSKKYSSTSSEVDSIYTWSIKSGSAETTLEESYFKNYKSTPKSTNKNSRHLTRHSTPRPKKNVCRDHDLHSMLKEPCCMDLDELTAISRQMPSYSESALLDATFKRGGVKLPRTSTKIGLSDAQVSGNSSVEARRSSLPDLLSISSPSQSIPSSSSYSSPSTNLPPQRPPFEERTGCSGKSSTSGSSNPASSAKTSGYRVNSLASSVNPDTSISLSSANIDHTTHVGRTRTDFLITDSPTSVNSSGIFAPYNSPDVASHKSSRRGSTKSESGSSGSSRHLTNVSSIPFHSTLLSSPEFKKPRTPPLRRMNARTRNSLERTSTPKSWEPSTLRDSHSCRKLFGSSETKLVNKKAVIKKLKRFSQTFYKKDKSGKIETLATL